MCPNKKFLSTVEKLVVALKQCSRDRDLEQGKALHTNLVASGLHTNTYILAALITMYSKCRRMASARELFERIPKKDVVTWTCLILGYVENGQGLVALELFARMDCTPDHVTYVAALKACVNLACQVDPGGRQFSLEKGMAVHERIKRHNLCSKPVIANTLVDMYSKCHNMVLARQVFEQMPRRSTVSWNCLLLGYVENGESFTALELFESMDCQPDRVTYLAALKACGTLASERDSERHVFLEKGREIHERVKKRAFASHISLANTLVDMYCKCREVTLAGEVVRGMPRKDVVTWNCLILGYVENGESQIALETFNSMDSEPDHITYLGALKACASLASERKSQTHGVLETGVAIHEQLKRHGFESNVAVASTLVDMYSRCRSMRLAREVFQGMKTKNVVTWNCLLQGCVDNEESSLALDLFFTSMDCRPDHVTYLTVLKACGIRASLQLGRLIHSTLCKLGLEEVGVVAGTLVDFYGRCGCISTAVHLFESLRSPDKVAWNALMAGYNSTGNSSQVLRLASEFGRTGLEMDTVTLVCILTACSHAGLVDEGIKYFQSMKSHGFSPSLEHYNCVVDMLGRANRLQEALALVQSMPYKGDKVTWMTLLGACRRWRNVDVGKAAFDALLELNVKVPSAYVMMRDLYKVSDEQEVRPSVSDMNLGNFKHCSALQESVR